MYSVPAFSYMMPRVTLSAVYAVYLDSTSRFSSAVRRHLSLLDSAVQVHSG